MPHTTEPMLSGAHAPQVERENPHVTTREKPVCHNKRSCMQQRRFHVLQLRPDTARKRNQKRKKNKCGEGSKKRRSSRMHLNLKDYLFKTTRYSYRSTYMNPIITKNQKSTIDTQKLERQEHSILLKKITKLQGKKQKEQRKV